MTQQHPYVGRHRATETDDAVLSVMLTEEDIHTAIDGCPCDERGQCDHGYPSWVIALGL